MIEVTLKLRPHQQTLWDTTARFAVWVCHRRFGKTYLAVAKLVVGALTCPRKNPRFAYLAATYAMAKGIAWSYVKDFLSDLPGVQFNEAELRAILPNGAEIRLLGAENYDRLRGLYLDGAVFDETALIPTPAWSTVVSPMLADRNGWAIFIGTPLGRTNLFHDLFDYAKTSGDPEWSQAVYTVDDTDVLAPAEVERMKRTSTPEEVAQELYCAWNSAIRGAFFAKELGEADRAGRITAVPFDPSLDVGVALDLGWSDLMVAILFQVNGGELRIPLCLAFEQTDFAGLVRNLRDLPYPPSYALAPHDIEVHELGTGKSRKEVLEGLGLPVRTVPRIASKHEAIDQARRVLPMCYFDAKGTKTLVEGLLGYRAGYDEVRRVQRMNPEHSWHSHYADAFMTLACGDRSTGGWGKLDLSAYANVKW